jgi:hypothetical protein
MLMFGHDHATFRRYFIVQTSITKCNQTCIQSQTLLHAYKKLTTVLQHVSITTIKSFTLHSKSNRLVFHTSAIETQYGMILYTVKFPSNIISCNLKSISSISFVAQQGHFTNCNTGKLIVLKLFFKKSCSHFRQYYS